jgi:hypothetical protein
MDATESVNALRLEHCNLLALQIVVPLCKPFKLLARGRGWLEEILTNGGASAESIAKRERCTVRQVNMTISLAFLMEKVPCPYCTNPDRFTVFNHWQGCMWENPRERAPDLVKAAIEGALPRGIGVTRLFDAAAEWSIQHAMLGLPW